MGRDGTRLDREFGRRGRSNIGQILVKYWSGQILVRSNFGGQILARLWSNVCQILVKCRSDIGQACPSPCPGRARPNARSGAAKPLVKFAGMVKSNGQILVKQRPAAAPRGRAGGSRPARTGTPPRSPPPAPARERVAGVSLCASARARVRACVRVRAGPQNLRGCEVAGLRVQM